MQGPTISHPPADSYQWIAPIAPPIPFHRRCKSTFGRCSRRRTPTCTPPIPLNNNISEVYWLRIRNIAKRLFNPFAQPRMFLRPISHKKISYFQSRGKTIKCAPRPPRHRRGLWGCPQLQVFDPNGCGRPTAGLQTAPSPPPPRKSSFTVGLGIGMWFRRGFTDWFVSPRQRRPSHGIKHMAYMGSESRAPRGSTHCATVLLS